MTDTMNAIQRKSVLHPTCANISNDKNEVANDSHEKSARKGRHSCFEWFHLIAAICIPIIIAIYTFFENHKDMQIANITRTSEMEIAQANRLNEILIAEQSRQKDRDLAIDQQRADILFQYQEFLAKCLADNGLTLNKSPSAKIVAQFMTTTALSQLDGMRKRYILQSLHQANLITLTRESTELSKSILELEQVDLSNAILGSLHNTSEKGALEIYYTWNYLWLPGAIFINASFRLSFVHCSNFRGARMNSVDFSFVRIPTTNCFTRISDFMSSFLSTSLVYATFYDADFVNVDFHEANLTLANMRKFYCANCNFAKATMVKVDLSNSNIHNNAGAKRMNNFLSVNLTYAVAHSAWFHSLTFDNSDWSHGQVFDTFVTNCTFINATIISGSFMKSKIKQSIFRNANLSNIDLSYAVLNNVSFANADMRNAKLNYMECNYCDFTNVKLQGGVFKNASIRYSNFFNCQVNISQLEEAIDRTGSRLPDGTFVENND